MLRMTFDPSKTLPLLMLWIYLPSSLDLGTIVLDLPTVFSRFTHGCVRLIFLCATSALFQLGYVLGPIFSSNKFFADLQYFPKQCYLLHGKNQMIIIHVVQGIILVAHSKSGIFWIPCNSNFSVNEGSQFGFKDCFAQVTIA